MPVTNPGLEDLLPESGQTVGGVDSSLLDPNDPTLQSQSNALVADDSSAPDLLASNDPTLRTVQANETVQGQLADLTTSGNPLLEQSKSNVQTQHARRGGQNDLMAAQAGEQAFLTKALEIATPDAATYDRAAAANQQATNVFEKANLDYEQTYEINKQTQRHAHEMSAQEFDQNIGMIKANHAASIQQLGQELINAGILSSQQHGELLEALQIEQDNTLEKLTSEYDLRSSELSQQLGNALTQIDAQSAAQLQVDAAADSRRLQLQYLQETGAIMRQAMQDISQINTTEGLGATAQRAAVNDVNSKLQADLGLLASYYQTVPGWNSQWSAGGSTSGGDTGSGGAYDPYGGNGSSSGGTNAGGVDLGDFGAGGINIHQGTNPPNSPSDKQLWSNGQLLQRYDASSSEWQSYNPQTSQWETPDGGSTGGSSDDAGDDSPNPAYANTSNPDFNPDQPYTVANRFPNPTIGATPSGYSLATDGSDWSSTVTVPPGNGGEAWGYSNDGSNRLVELGRTADGGWRVVYPPSLVEQEEPSSDAGANGFGVNPGTGVAYTQAHLDKFSAQNPNWDLNSNSQIDPEEWANFQLGQSPSTWTTGWGADINNQKAYYNAITSGMSTVSAGKRQQLQALLNSIWPNGAPG